MKLYLSLDHVACNDNFYVIIGEKKNEIFILFIIIIIFFKKPLKGECIF